MSRVITHVFFYLNKRVLKTCFFEHLKLHPLNTCLLEATRVSGKKQELDEYSSHFFNISGKVKMGNQE